MPEDQTGATGTENGGDAQATGTSQATDPNAESDADKIKRLEAIVEQSKAEKTTLESLKAKVQELESRHTPAAEDPEDDEEVDWDAVGKWAKPAEGRGADPVAKAQLALAKKVAWMEFNADLKEIEDKNEREETRKLYLSNPKAYGTVRVAHREIRERNLESQMEELRKENERLKERRDPDVLNAPSTGAGRDVTAIELRKKKVLTDAEWERSLADLTPLERLKRQGEAAKYT